MAIDWIHHDTTGAGTSSSLLGVQYPDITSATVTSTATAFPGVTYPSPTYQPISVGKEATKIVQFHVETITNGFLLVMGNKRVYCKDYAAIGEALVANLVLNKLTDKE